MKATMFIQVFGVSLGAPYACGGNGAALYGVADGAACGGNTGEPSSTG